MKKTVITIIAIVIVFIIALAIFSSGDNKQSSEDGETAKKVQTAADFNKLASLEFKDYEGNIVKLTDFAGTPMIVNSWATWCPFCVQELSDFAEVKKEFGDDILIIAIDRAESISSAKRFSDNIGVTDVLTMLVDDGDDFYRSIGGFSMPETIFIGIGGEIKDHKRGPMTVVEMEDKINKLFGLVPSI